MANPFDEAILEGFICPKCMVTFGTSELLSHHFILEHGKPESTNYCDRTPNSNGSSNLHKNSNLSHAFYELPSAKQSIGAFSSLTDEFESLRKSCINLNLLETNNLLIRLEKLSSETFQSSNERKIFEQTVVPWIGDKVNLCPSCGKSFGLGAETIYDDDDGDDGGDNATTTVDKTMDGNLKQGNLFWQKNKKRVERLTHAILDYNPIYRRRHHCRLCGHVLCADCSYFISISNAQLILSVFSVHNLDAVANDSNVSKFDLMKLFIPNGSHDYSESGDKQSANLQQNYDLRICHVCKFLFECKINRLKISSNDCVYVQLHQELRGLMDKVNSSLPNYTSIAKSLSSGEQKYALELAGSMHSELLKSLQRIEAIGRQFANISQLYPSPNRPLIRLGSAISRQTRGFVQTNLPPLRTLPTLKQYDHLTAQRKDDLAARWREEDNALAELTKRVTEASNQSPSKSKETSPKSDDLVVKLGTIAQQIDQVSSQMMHARCKGQNSRADQLAKQLDQLEHRFRVMSARVNNNNNNSDTSFR